MKNKSKKKIEKNGEYNISLDRGNKKKKNAFGESRSEDEIVREVVLDYENRKFLKRAMEQNWLLNMNFLVGNQFSYINSAGEIDEIERKNSAESREVFNHIAPIVESRLAKLGRVRPSFGVRPASASESDLETAKLTKKILDSVSSSLNIPNLLTDATMWSEVTGTVFYKLVWNCNTGTILGYRLPNGEVLDTGTAEKLKEKYDFGEGSYAEGDEKRKNESGDDFDISKLTPLYDGDVSISVCSPFEIFPENNSLYELNDQPSLIHARAIDEGEFEERYGFKAEGETLNTLSLDSTLGSDGFLSGRSSIKKVVGERVDNLVLVIEKWIKPCKTYPNGRLTVVGGGRLLFDGCMPYSEYPFVKQVSNRVVGSFWGVSVVERCIPIQRAYNSVKNRKLECMSRLCGGVLAVEEGSVDVDDLEDNGLMPGKILVYRNGANVPSFMDAGVIPHELSEEEERLSNELISISGVSELMRNSTLPSQVNSGTAINLLIEQDDTRLSVTAENIRNALLQLSKNILNMYKMFVDGYKLAKVTDEFGRLQVFYWNKSDISSSDIVLETANELSESLSSRKQMVFELLKYGLLQNDEGKLDERTKNKVIEMLGFGNWENGVDETALQINRAKMENIMEGTLYVLPVDNHTIHIKEHTKQILELGAGGGISNKMDRLLKHIQKHKEVLQSGDQTSPLDELMANYKKNQ